MTDEQLIARNILKLARGGMRPIQEGRQRSTTRIGLRTYTLGSALLVDGANHLRIFVTLLEALLFGELERAHATTEGFPSTLELKKKIGRFYPEIRNDDYVTYVRFDLVEQAPIQKIQRGKHGRDVG